MVRTVSRPMFRHCQFTTRTWRASKWLAVVGFAFENWALGFNLVLDRGSGQQAGNFLEAGADEVRACVVDLSVFATLRH